jgi:hypothetical protein
MVRRCRWHLGSIARECGRCKRGALGRSGRHSGGDQRGKRWNLRVSSPASITSSNTSLDIIKRRWVVVEVALRKEIQPRVEVW